jgi:nitrogenase-stabilizing/protective protein
LPWIHGTLFAGSDGDRSSPKEALMSSILDILNGLSAAEEFFSALDVGFDQSVLNVSRLHILKRFNEYIKDSNVDCIDDNAKFEVCRSALTRAYNDFTKSSGVKEKVFKVFNQAASPAGFVPIDSLKKR